MNISEPFIRRPIATTLLMIGLFLAGIVAFGKLPVAALPQVDYPIIVVSTYLPGASADTVASTITTPLERQFGQIPSLDDMTSVSSFGFSQVTLRFTLDRDIDGAQQDVQAAINAASNLLPKTLPAPPTYSKSNPADQPVITLSVSSDALSLRQVDDFADSILAQKISQISGVGLVTLNGAQKPAVRVKVDAVALAGTNLTMEDVRSAITNANTNQPKGNLDGAHQDYVLATDDQLVDAASFRPIIIGYSNGSAITVNQATSSNGSATGASTVATSASTSTTVTANNGVNGAALRLGDIALVEDGVENEALAGWANEHRAVILNIMRQPGANVIDVADAVKALLPKLKQALPDGLDVKVIADKTETVRASVKDVEFTLLLTIGLVVGVIYFFLRSVRATIIPGVAVPLSLIVTFGVMYALGYSLNNLSLMAMTISTGFVVDDAIVMIENVQRHIELGKKPFEAALIGAKEIGFTIISLTVSLVAVLIPLLFMGGLVGRLFREFAITLAIAIAVSALLSLSLTPMMCAHLLKDHDPNEKHNFVVRASEATLDWMVRVYDIGLVWVLKHRTTTLLITLATVGATVVSAIVVPKGFFPEEDTGSLVAVTEASPDVSFPRMMELQEEAAAVVLKDPDVASVASFIGSDGTNATTNSGRLSITLKPAEKRKASAEVILARLKPEIDKIAGMNVYLQSVQDLQIDSRASRTQYQYTLEDANADELRDFAPKLVAELAKSPLLSDVASDQGAYGLGVNLVVDRDTASRLGVTSQAIDDTLYDAFGQRQVSTIYTQLNLYRVILEVSPGEQKSANSLDNVFVRSTAGAPVRLSAFTRWVDVPSPLSINHEGQFASVTISFNVAKGESLGDAVKVIDAAEGKLGLPQGIHAAFQGSAAAFQEALASEPMLILAALITVYIVLGILYESFIHPVTILSTLPSAGVGALLALIICKSEFSVIALIGIVLLIGIVKKNAIMMIDFALEAQRTEGMSPVDAIHKACLLRFRPIMMTTMAALLGGLPLALGSGMGSELRRPLGISIVGGLIFSQVLTLYTTPVIYLAMGKVGKFLHLKESGTSEGEGGGPGPQPPPPSHGHLEPSGQHAS